MKTLGATLALIAAAGAASAQMVPIGAPIIPKPKTSAAPPPSSAQSSRMRPATPLSSNYSPYSVPQAALGSASTGAATGTVASGSTDVQTAGTPRNTARKPKSSSAQSDMEKLAPKAPERTELPQASAEAPR